MARNPLLLLLLVVAAASAAVPVFHGDARDKVTAGFKKRGRQGTDYTKITVDWSLVDLVENIADLDTSKSRVEVKAGDGDWVRENGVMKRGTFKATVRQVAPCKSHEVRFVVVSKEGEEATSPFTVTVDPATPEQIEESRFTPEAPTNLVARSLEGNKVEISWDASECATHYEIFGSAGASSAISGSTEGETSIVLDAESCEQYEIAVTAYTGQEASDDATTDLITSPSEGAAEKLEISVESEVYTAKASWNGWELSCVADYAVQLCKDGACEESVAVKRDSYGGESVFAPETQLEECSEYTLKVKPIFEGLDLSPKEVAFTTKAPLMVHVEGMLGTVTAEAGDEQMVTINWSAVKCASTYTVYQKQALEGSDWEEMEKVGTEQLSTQGVPCTQYNYGVTVTINGEESGMVETDEVLVIPMDTSVPFHPSSLHMNPTETGLTATWEHAQCITAYRVEVCEAGTEHCVEPTIDLTATHEQEVAAESLKPCTEYTMKIFATSEIEMDAEVQTFTTLSPAATPPADLTAELNPTTGKIDVAFSPVQCASKYKIFMQLDDGELVETLDTSATTNALEAPEPCTAFSIGASSVIGEEESDQSDMVEGLVPAQSNEASSPKLLSVTAENNTVEFIVNKPEQNKKCQVEKYEVKYISLGAMSEQQQRTLDPSEMAEDGTLVIEDFPGAADKAMRLEARILYSDGVFSPWISSKEPNAIDPTENNSNGLLVPIVIGILLAVVVLLVVIFFIVKRRRSQSKYDPENAQNDEESKQLKESNPEV